MIELHKKSGDYILYKDEDQRLILMVLDTLGVFEIEYVLNSGECYSYESHGEQILPLISRRVRDEKYIE
ncbi:hypothetical protein [Flavobacterium sp.]|uniref:hypothetical protein n=1 Tax=Flavobacterium sp. TaxID=239 RepID=UPI0011FEA113|nr:hypothetical protein [Flavobacterium sp.]RZJ69935.1 MAG: hypothetical protein EOO49_16005 [Flavobacterium sp.]